MLARTCCAVAEVSVFNPFFFNPFSQLPTPYCLDISPPGSSVQQIFLTESLTSKATCQVRTRALKRQHPGRISRMTRRFSPSTSTGPARPGSRARWTGGDTAELPRAGTRLVSTSHLASYFLHFSTPQPRSSVPVITMIRLVSQDWLSAHAGGPRTS